jgi:hypothetical protein
VTITDQAAAAGINIPPDWSFSAAVADFNGDGWPDLFVSHLWHPANLFINNKDGTFSAADQADMKGHRNATTRLGCEVTARAGI